MKARKTQSQLLLIALAQGIALVLAACGSSGSDSSSQANEVDRGFVAEMIPHHALAVDMAEVAAKEGQHPEIQQLAANIISTQNAEIKRMRGIENEIRSSDSDPAMDGMSGTQMDGMSGGRNMVADAQAMGLTMDAMGMSMSAADLKGARPFDREFIDMMVPHHSGAIRMAQAELRRGENPQLRAIARGIIKAQGSEINQMQRWRSNWFDGAGGGHAAQRSQMNQGGQMPTGN